MKNSRLIVGLLGTALASAHAQSIAPQPAAPTPAAENKPVPPPTKNSTEEEELIILSPFTVSADEDAGYQAGNTISGSRLNSRLKDTAAPITAFTPEFLSDFGINNVDELLSYSANYEKDYEDSNAGFNSPASRGSSAANSQFRIRGLAGTFGVDLIESQVPPDGFNIERVELSSGPNSVLFGLGAAGGTVSLTSKMAKTNRTIGSVKATFGSWNFRRFELDHNQVLVKNKLAIRLNGLVFDRDGWRSYDYEKSRRIAAAVAWTPLRTTTFRLAYDGGTHGRHTDWNWPAGDAYTLWKGRGAIVKDGAADTPNGINQIASTPRWTFTDNNLTTVNLQGELQSFPGTGFAADALLPETLLPSKYGFSGPSSRLRGFYRNYSAKFEHKIGDLIVEGAYLHTYNKSYANGWAVPGNVINVRGDPNLNIPNPIGSGTIPNPYAGQLYIDNTWRPEDTAFKNNVLRLTAAYEKKLGKWGRHRIAGLAETGQVEQERHIFQEILVDQFNVPVSNIANPHNDQNQLFRRHYFAEGDYQNYYQSSLDITPPVIPFGTRLLTPRMVGFNQNGNSNDRKITDTLMLATQSYFFKDRVITTLGYRRDWVKFKNGLTVQLPSTDSRVISGEALVNEWAILPGQWENSTFEPSTFTAGVVTHLNDRISLFYNQSNNVGAPSFTARILPPSGGLGGITPPMTDGESRDYGIMFDPFGDDRYFIRVTRFESTYLNSTPVQPGTHPWSRSTNLNSPTRITEHLANMVRAGSITQAQADFWIPPAPIPTVGAFSVDVESEGFEVELIANPIKQLTIRGAFSYSDRNRDNFFKELEPWYTQFKAFIDSVPHLARTPGTPAVDYDVLVGVPTLVANPGTTGAGLLEQVDIFVNDTGLNQIQPFSSRPYKFTINTRYSFTDGSLKGLAIGGAWRWQDKNYMQKDLRATVNNQPNPDFGKEYYGKVSQAWDAFATYKTKLPWFDNKVTFQINVRNLFNESLRQPAKLTADLTNQRRVYLNEPRSIRFSTEIEF